MRALGLELPARGGVAQVSTNVEDHLAVPLAALVAAVARHADVAGCELVGLAPARGVRRLPGRRRRSATAAPSRRRSARRTNLCTHLWRRRRRSGAASIAATPPASSRRAGARGASRRAEERKLSEKEAAARRPPRAPEQAADVALGRQPRRARGGRLRRPARRCCSTPPVVRAIPLTGVRVPLLHPARLLHRPVRLQPPAEAGSEEARIVMDVQMFTVGPVQENCFLARARRRRRTRSSSTRARRRRGCCRRSRRSALDARRDPAHAHALRPRRRGRAGRQGDRRAGLLPGARGPGAAGHHGLRPVARLRPVRVLGPRADRRRAARRSSSPA